jgi:hypothetical protein
MRVVKKINKPKYLSDFLRGAKASMKRVGSSLLGLGVFMATSLWLAGPGTNAGAFDFARLLVPGIARDLLYSENGLDGSHGWFTSYKNVVSQASEQARAESFSPTQAAMVQVSLPALSIAGMAATIPGHLIDLEAVDRHSLKSDQERKIVSQYLVNKYRITPSDSMSYINEAQQVAKEVNLDPILLLAVMAIESSFDPNAQSKAGAQGLMQVLTNVHQDKFEPFGGIAAAFIPEVNIRVGALILKACIAKAGSLEAGLRSYLGSPNAASGETSYTSRVLSEREQLRNAARGQRFASI